MKHAPSFLPPLAAAALALLIAPVARAQFGGQPGGMPPGGGMGPAPQGQGEEPKVEGPAEEAPEEEAPPSDVQPLGSYPNQARRSTQVIQLDGYFRARGNYYHQFDLGQTYITGAPGAGPNGATPPFPLPLECGVSDQNAAKCGSHNLGDANLRLRLEPTINITDQVRVVSQIDVLDNTIMGSTPDTLVNVYRPGERGGLSTTGILSNSQNPPEAGSNGFLTSIRAKRAWAEIDSEFGSIRAGRMPWHFGRGIFYNNGNCQDCDGGTTVDRVMGLTTLYGHQLALSWDFGSQGYTLGMTDVGSRDVNGPPLDLSQRDDVLQLMAAITRVDDDAKFQERANQGELMLNYGAQLVYRKQGYENFNLVDDRGSLVSATVESPVPLQTLQKNGAQTATAAGTGLVPVNSLAFLPSLWMKMAWKGLTVEAEASGVFGKIGNAGPLTADTANPRLTLKQVGWVLASELRLYKNAFFLGFETGGATGDQAENPYTYLNYRWKSVQQPLGDHSITDFKFSPDYHVDEILFRRIIGTVTNAAYAKPKMTYWLDLPERRQVGLTAAFIYSMALQPVSTPGNSLNYGVEMNLGLTYRNPNDHVFGGIIWAVLWPMAALNRPGPSQNSGTPLWQVSQDASAAQALRLFMGIKF